MLSGNVQPMRDAEAILRSAEAEEKFGVASTVYESRDFAMIDVIHPQCSKGAALAEWSALRGLAREEVMAIGDNHNALEMLSFAGIPLAMGNSVADLRNFCYHKPPPTHPKSLP